MPVTLPHFEYPLILNIHVVWTGTRSHNTKFLMYLFHRRYLLLLHLLRISWSGCVECVSQRGCMLGVYWSAVKRLAAAACSGNPAVRQLSFKIVSSVDRVHLSFCVNPSLLVSPLSLSLSVCLSLSLILSLSLCLSLSLSPSLVSDCQKRRLLILSGLS